MRIEVLYMGVRFSVLSGLVLIFGSSLVGCGVYENKHPSLPVDLTAIMASSGPNTGISYAQVNKLTKSPY